MDKRTERLYFAFLTEPREIGESTPRSPQHLTLVPPFVAEPYIAKEAAATAAKNSSRFPIQIGEKIYLGQNQEIEAYSIARDSLLRVLHSTLMDELRSRGLNTLHMKYVDSDYVPHITVKPAHPELVIGSSVIVDHIALMHKDDKYRTLLAREELK